MPFILDPKMWAKIFLPFVGLLWGATLPLTSSQDATSAILVCTLSGSVPEDMTIMWQAGGQSGNTSDIIIARFGNTYLSLRQQRWWEQNYFTCQVSLSGSQTKVNEPEGNHLHENLYHTNHEEISLQPAQTTLTGMVIGLNASEVSIQWVKTALVEGHHVISRILKGSINVSPLAISQVIVPYSDWKNGTSYSCRFTREADTMKLTQTPEKKFRGEK